MLTSLENKVVCDFIADNWVAFVVSCDKEGLIVEDCKDILKEIAKYKHSF